MEEKLQVELEKINKFMDRLNDIAIADGVISDDEQSILDAIFNQIGDYRQLIFDVLEDGIIDDDEKVKVKSFQEKIVSLVNDKALTDGRISKDEEELIDSLFQFTH